MIAKNKLCTAVCLTMACVLSLAGCGGASPNMSADKTTEAYDYATDDIYLNENSSYEEIMAEEQGTDVSNGETQVKDTSRKLIKNVDLDVETEEFDALMQTVTDKAENLGGYVESGNTYNGSYYNGSSNRNANLTLRIPAEHLDEFLSAVAENSNVIRKNENVTDVTLQYVDMKSHKEALETERERLLELLEQAESVEDIITIESRLSEVRYQIESMESQLRTMDNQVSYSTVYLYIEEVTRLTPVKEQTTWEKISTGFVDNLHNVGRGIKNFFIGLIINIPYLAVWAAVIIIVVLLIRSVRKIRIKRKTAKQEKKLNQEQKEESKMQKEEK